MNKENFSYNLKTARSICGLSQVELSKLSGASQPSICLWENGKIAEESSIQRLEKAMGIVNSKLSGHKIKSKSDMSALISKLSVDQFQSAFHYIKTVILNS